MYNFARREKKKIIVHHTTHNILHKERKGSTGISNYNKVHNKHKTVKCNIS